MTQAQHTQAEMERVGEVVRDFLQTVDYSEWGGQTLAVNLDTLSVVRAASSAELAKRYGPNFVVVCFGKIDTALRPRRVR